MSKLEGKSYSAFRPDESAYAYDLSLVPVGSGSNSGANIVNIAFGNPDLTM